MSEEPEEVTMSGVEIDGDVYIRATDIIRWINSLVINGAEEGAEAELKSELVNSVLDWIDEVSKE